MMVRFSLILFAVLVSVVAQAADVPQSFTLDGRLFSNPEGTTPLADSSVGMRLQILDEDKLCILYEETQTISTLASQGYFSIQVGSTLLSPKRTAGDSGKTMTEVFTNLNAITGRAVADGNPCNIAAAGGKRRFVRMIVSPTSLGGAPRTLSPDLSIDSVPNAVIAERAESLQGLRGTDVLKVNTAAGSALSQSNLESLFTSPTRFTALSSIVDGTSSSYMRSNSTAGAQLPVLPGAPNPLPAAGSVWFDSSDEKLKYQTSGGPITLTTGAGAISALTGDVTAAGTGSVTATVATVGGSTAANVGAATVLANASTDTSTNSAIVRRDAAAGFAAGQITNTSTRFKDAATNYVTLKAANAVTSYSITLPAAVGSTGQTLVATDNAGALAWQSIAIADSSITYGSKAQNTVLAAPASGGPGVPTFRTLASADLPAGTATAAGTAGKLAKYTGTTAMGNSIISDDGAQITVAGNVVSTPGNVATGGTIDLRVSNSHILNDVQSSTITLQNPANGGLYNIVVADMASRTYTFSGCTNAYFKPANGPTTLNTQTVYGVLMVSAGGSNFNCYITWSTGFQP
ncbi:hypothetical protein BH10BDE1_BH10BDE1_33990 [soil metagenome]